MFQVIEKIEIEKDLNWIVKEIQNVIMDNIVPKIWENVSI